MFIFIPWSDKHEEKSPPQKKESKKCIFAPLPGICVGIDPGGLSLVLCRTSRGTRARAPFQRHLINKDMAGALYSCTLHVMCFWIGQQRRQVPLFFSLSRVYKSRALPFTPGWLIWCPGAPLVRLKRLMHSSSSSSFLSGLPGINKRENERERTMTRGRLPPDVICIPSWWVNRRREGRKELFSFPSSSM